MQIFQTLEYFSAKQQKWSRINGFLYVKFHLIKFYALKLNANSL